MNTPEMLLTSSSDQNEKLSQNEKTMMSLVFAFLVAFNAVVIGQVVNPNWGKVTRLDSPTVYFSLFVEQSIQTVDVEKIPETGGDYFLRLKVTYTHGGEKIHALICGERFYAGTQPQNILKEGFIRCDDIRKHVEANMSLLATVGQQRVYKPKPIPTTCG